MRIQVPLLRMLKRKVLTEDRSFSLGFGNQGGLTLGETTEAEEVEDEGVGAPVNDVVEEQEEDFGDGPLGIETGIDVDNADIYGDGEVPLEQVVTEHSSFEDVKGEYDRLNTEYDSYDMDAMQGLGDQWKYDVDDRRKFSNLDQERQRISNLYYKMSQEDPMEENLAEGGSFAKYNITLQDKMDLLGEQREDKKRYNFDTIEIDAENKEEEKILNRFDNILKRQGFNFTNTVSGADDDNYNHHHFYEWKDDVKDTIQVHLTQVDDRIMTGEWGYGDYYNITYSPADNAWEESVTIDGAMNKDTIQDFKRDIKTVLKDNMDKSERDWY